MSVGSSRALRRCAGAALIAAVVSLASCGVPVESDDRPLSGRDIAYVPRTEPPPTTTTIAPRITSTTIQTPVTTAQVVRDPLDVYWVTGESIAPLRRNAVEATVASAVEALRSGPGASETIAGYRSSITSPDMILAASEGDGMVTVDLSDEFLSLPGGEQLLALSQMVYTLTDIDGVGLVQFRLDDVALAVPTSDGSSKTKPVSRDDYDDVLWDFNVFGSATSTAASDDASDTVTASSSDSATETTAVSGTTGEG